VFTVYLAVAALILGSPMLIVADGLIVQGCAGLLAAAAAGGLAVSIRPGEASHLTKLLRGIWPIALIPALLMLIQLIPLPIPGLARSIWAMSRQALGTPLASSVTIDPGATVVALGRYLSFVTVLVLATAIAIDRQRAERILFLVIAAYAAVAATLLVHDMGGFTFLGEISSGGTRDAIAASCTLGTAVAAACVVLVVERHETRRLRGEQSKARSLTALALVLAALATFWVIITVSDTNDSTFAACCGTAVIAIIVLVRRLGLGPWAASLLCLLAALAAVTIALTKGRPLAADLALRYAVDAPADVVAIAERMIADAGWAGSGAATFRALLPIYRGLDTAPNAGAPTFAAQLAIELGRPGLWLCVALALVPIVLFVRGALQRGRDSFHPMAGAAAGVTALIEAFGDNGLSSTAVAIPLAALLGLALAQSVSRTLSG
jgi:hypothetical protein